MQATLEVRGKRVPAGWVVGAPSRLLDAWTEAPVLLRTPAFQYPDHVLTFDLADGVSARGGQGTGLVQRFRGKREAVMGKDSEVFFDARYDATDNVAHILQNHLAVILTGLRALGMAGRVADVTVVVHDGTPKYALSLYGALGFRTLAADSAVRGTVLRMTPDKFPLRSTAAAPLRARALECGLLGEQEAPGELVFLSRRKRRTLSNLAEITELLGGHGYRSVYVEDLAVEDQIRLVAGSPGIFALHGASLGFLLFRRPGFDAHIVEAFSTGYASNWARANCAEVGTRWVGLQGPMEGEKYRTRSHPREFEATNYRLHPDSVRAALTAVADARLGEAERSLELLDECMAVTVGSAR